MAIRLFLFTMISMFPGLASAKPMDIAMAKEMLNSVGSAVVCVDSEGYVKPVQTAEMLNQILDQMRGIPFVVSAPALNHQGRYNTVLCVTLTKK